LSKLPVIIVDVDGTIANIDHRLHLLKEEGDHWSKFFSGMAGDSVNNWCKELIEHMKGDYGILLVSGRPDNFRTVTEGWLNDNNISYDGLYMRQAGDRRPDSQIKQDIYLNNIKETFDVLFVVDDRKAVVDMWRSLGLTVLHCAVGDY
jgi:hypothetical protein